MTTSDALALPPDEIWYEAGSHVYREQWLHGRLIGAYHSPTGRPRSTSAIDALVASHLGDLPLEAFDLTINGARLVNHWQARTVEHDAEDSQQGQHTLLTLVHDAQPIQLIVHTRTDGSPFLVRWLDITNTGAHPLALTAVTPFAGLLWYLPNYRERLADTTPVPFTLGHFARHDFGHEGAFTWQPLPVGRFTTSSHTGHSGWGLPWCIVRNEVTGAWVLAHLAWSGNWTMAFTLNAEPEPFDGTAFLRAGPQADALLTFAIAPTAPAPQRFIAPGETVTTPAVHLGLFHGDMAAGIQALHTHLRRSVFAPMAPEQSLLIGAGMMVAEPISDLHTTIAVAADLGCEYVQVDAGWYGRKPGSWDTMVGDWQVGDWLPHGLTPLREAIHAHGMRFGLWMEPESVGRDSQLAREHPEWIVQRDGLPIAGGRALDVGLPEVAAWMEAEMERVIQEHSVELFKLDFNTHIRNGGERQQQGDWENTLWRHVEALYAIFARIRAHHPEVLFENCASGGGRNDLGLLRFFDIACLSDYGPASRALPMLYHLTLALPPERLRWYVGHMEDGLHEGGEDVHFPWHLALFTNPLFVGFPPEAAQAESLVAQRYRRFIARYKTEVRPLLPTCQVFHHTPPGSASPWLALEYAHPDHTRGYAGIFRMNAGDQDTYRLHLRGVKSQGHYRVEWETNGETALLTGYQLRHEGVLIQRTHPFTSEVVFYQLVEEPASSLREAEPRKSWEESIV